MFKIKLLIIIIAQIAIIGLSIYAGYSYAYRNISDGTNTSTTTETEVTDIPIDINISDSGNDAEIEDVVVKKDSIDIDVEGTKPDVETYQIARLRKTIFDDKDNYAEIFIKYNEYTNVFDSLNVNIHAKRESIYVRTLTTIETHKKVRFCSFTGGVCLTMNSDFDSVNLDYIDFGVKIVEKYRVTMPVNVQDLINGKRLKLGLYFGIDF